MLPQKDKIFRIIVSCIVCVILLFGAIAIVVFRQNIIDAYVYNSFKPTFSVSALANRIDFSQEGRFYFFASQPRLEKSSLFNQVCSSVEKTTSILGCYSDYQIFVYDVVDERLDGIREVTAAHEMLHAVFQRLSKSEKERLGVLLEYEYSKLVDNKELVDLMDFYERTEPGERINELHSIIGTTIRDIGGELEAYYSNYFTSRKKIVAYYEKYSGVFKTLNERSKSLSQELNQLAIDIPAKSEQYNSSVQKLNTDIRNFNSRAENNDFSSQYQFYTERQALELRVIQVNSQKEDINSSINYYNQILKEYNSITIESRELYNSINSTLVEAPSV